MSTSLVSAPLAGGLRLAAPRWPVLDGTGVLLLLALYGLVWALLYAFTTLSPPVDNVEQLVWLHSMEWGYYKHPPLPTWIVGALAQAFPPGAALTYTLGAVITTASMALLWRLLHQLRGPRYATLGLLAALSISLYCGRIYYYNHNVVLLLWVVLAADLSWRVAQRPRLRTWAALGLVTGLGMLTKYQFVLALAVIGLWWLHLQGWRQPVHRRGAWLAAAVALLVFAPHGYWLFTHDWLPLAYARESALGYDLRGSQRLWHALQFALDWLFNRSLPAWLLLGSAWWWARRQPLPAAAAPLPDDGARRFLLLWGFVPLLLMMAMALFGGSKLHLHWGTAFMLWTVPAVMECARRAPWAELRTVRAAWFAFALVQALVMVQAWMASPQGPRGYKADHTDFFPSERVAAQIALQAPAVLGGPVEIVSGSQELASVLALRLPSHPRVLVDGQLRYSPWIAPAELRQRRAIEVFHAPAQLPAGAHLVGHGIAWRPLVVPAP
ncbi:MAG: glycosyltransferase family 39 protein [Comamonadaceae bacterium]|nr:glycosyltransferase family 39 protein [Comamonadaceae bacterium]